LEVLYTYETYQNWNKQNSLFNSLKRKFGEFFAGKIQKSQRVLTETKKTRPVGLKVL
jgi:hypothetical protein